MKNKYISLAMATGLALAACAAPTPTAAPKPAATAAPAAPAATTAPAAPAPAATTAPAAPAPAATAAPAAPAAAPIANTGNIIIGGFDVGPGGFPERFDNFNAGAGYYAFEFYLSKLVRYCDVTLSKMCGDLAEKWEVAPDGKTVTFSLKNAKWHDGSAVTADDVVFTISRQLDKGASRYAGFFSAISGSKDYADGKADKVSGLAAVDPKTVKISLDKPNTPLLDSLSFIGIIQKKQWEKVPPADMPKSDIWKNGIIGSGPFKLSKYVTGQYTEFVPFDDYFGGKPKVDKLINRYFPEAGTALIALQKGEIDFTYVTVDELDKLKSNADLKIIEGPSLVGQSMYLNLRIKEFDNKLVRQAIMHAVDRDTIIKTLWKGTALPSNCFYSPAGPYNSKNANPYKYDVAKAKALLKEANVDLAKLGEMEFLTYYGDQLSKDMLAVISEQLKEIGLKTKLRFVDVPTFNSEFYTKEPKWALGWVGAGNGPEPDNAYTSHHSSEEWPKGININVIKNAELDKLLDAGRVEGDPAKRQEIYQKICQLSNDEVLRGYMLESTRYGAASKKLGNFIYTPSPGGGRYLAYPEKWTKQ
ncbi:MAG: ABC transporter substrate-binding protein [Chloroflexi bacterium]|jgi:peptide/nickel transport system substrate-binding protein|nr:ABC transporter substrate-binding protein [Chloroflexota bacterium]